MKKRVDFSKPFSLTWRFFLGFMGHPVITLRESRELRRRIAAEKAQSDKG